MGVCSDAKYFLNVFPGQKAQITDCQVRKQITLTFTHEHTFIHLLYKCLLITHHVPGAGNSAARDTDAAPACLAFSSPLHVHEESYTRKGTNTLQHGPARGCTQDMHLPVKSFSCKYFSDFPLPPMATKIPTSCLLQAQRLTDGAQFTHRPEGP